MYVGICSLQGGIKKTMKVNVSYCFVMTLIVSLLVFTVSCVTVVTPESGTYVSGSGNLETREMDYSDFTRINVGDAFQVEITRADDYFVSITLDDNLFEYLDIEKRGDTLYIGMAPNYNYRHSTRQAIITMPNLGGLGLSGASKGAISGFSSVDSLQLEASGASFLNINDVKAGNTRFNISGASTVSGSIEIADGDFDVSGASTVELEGTAKDVSMEISGASSIKLEDFRVVNADVELSGASNATINASGRLDADVTGASRLNYIGNPTLGSITTSGGSTISQK